MKRFLSIFIVFCILLVCGCTDKRNTKEYQHNKTELMRIRTKIKAHHSIADEIGIDTLVQYFEQNGTDDERFLVNFYKGYYLFYNEEWISAYEVFRKNYEQRPSKKTELSDEVLRGTFTTCVLLCIRDRDTVKAKEWLELAEKSETFTESMYSLELSKATLAVYNHHDDSCVHCLDRAFEDIKKKKNWTTNLAWCLNEQAKILAMMGRTEDFKKRYELLKQHPNKEEDATTDLSKGLFYAQNGMRDSSLFFYKKAMQSETTDIALDACVRLAIDARNHGENDSVFKYFQDCVNLYDQLIEERQNSYSRRIEALYRNQELKDEIAEQKLHLMTLLFFVTLFILLAGAGWATSVRLRKRLKTSVKHIENLKREHAVLETKLQSVLEEVQNREKKRERTENEETRIQFDNLCFELKQYASNKQSAPHQLCNELMRQFVEMYHDSVQILQQKYSDIKPTDIFVCILVHSGFGLTEIARVTNHDRQEIRQFMQRISKGLSGTSVGRINDFRDLIASYFA